MNQILSLMGSVVGCIVLLIVSIVHIVLIRAKLAKRIVAKGRVLNNYLQAKRQMIDGLLRSVEAQNEGRLHLISARYDDLDMRIPRNQGPEFEKLVNALYFWDCWIDARNHNWGIYKGMQADDWPRLAMLIVTDLEADREINVHLKKL